AVAQEPVRGLGAESHSVEHVLIACTREDFLAMREVLVPRRMMAPVLDTLAQTVRNRLWPAVVSPERGIGTPAEHIMQLEKIDDPFPAIAERVVEFPRGVMHRAAAIGQQVGD